MQNLNNLIEELSRFGLSKNESIIYLELLKGGKSSAYQLTKKLALGRSKISAILKTLKAKNMIFEQRKSGTLEYVAHPYKNLAALVEIQESDLKSLKNSLGTLYKKFAKFTSQADKTASNIFHYYGISGLKQVIWNSLKAKDEMRIFEVSRLSAFLQQDFADEYRLECHKRGITHMDLTNEKHMVGWTDIEDFLKNQKLRYIDPSILKIQFEIMIYNDVVTMMDYKDNEIFCVEIHSPTLATLQKQLFDYIWKDAIKMKFIGPRGEAHIIKQI